MDSTIIQSSTIGVWESVLVAVISGLAVVAIPFVIKYFNKKFKEINDTAMIASETAQRVDRHHRENKKRLKKISKELIILKGQINGREKITSEG